MATTTCNAGGRGVFVFDSFHGVGATYLYLTTISRPVNFSWMCLSIDFLIQLLSRMGTYFSCWDGTPGVWRAYLI